MWLVYKIKAQDKEELAAGFDFVYINTKSWTLMKELWGEYLTNFYQKLKKLSIAKVFNLSKQ